MPDYVEFSYTPNGIEHQLYRVWRDMVNGRIAFLLMTSGRRQHASDAAYHLDATDGVEQVFHDALQLAVCELLNLEDALAVPCGAD